MEEYKCSKCENSYFNLIKEGSKSYGYALWKFKCSNCGEILENDKYEDLLKTFRKTGDGIDKVVDEFTKNVDSLKEGINNLKSMKDNTESLDSLLRKLSLIYYEEEAELTNSPGTLAILINKNLPNGVIGEIKEKRNKKDLDKKEIVLFNDASDHDEKAVLGTITISRGLKNIMLVDIKKDDRKEKQQTIDEPFRIIPILLRLNELFNYTT